MTPLTFLAVGLGGAIGALCRNKATALLKACFAEISRIRPSATGTSLARPPATRLSTAKSSPIGAFPAPTLIVNVTSCFIAGILLHAQAACDQTLYLALTMGFLGGFSTLSTMNYEAVELIMSKQVKIGLAYLAITYASTLGAAALGFALLP